MNKTEAIFNFLRDFAKPDLASMFSIDMECQVNVARDDGEPIIGEFHGKKWKAWTDNTEQWKSFRIPFNAATKPNYQDTEMKYNLAKHVEAIGMTGWNWKNLESRWVAYDFDAIAGHRPNHQNKMSDEELQVIIKAVSSIPWVQVRKSASGKGLHLYVYLHPYIKTENHHEHAALARAILSKMSAIACFDFNAKVDICGGNMWVWHRKMKGTDGFTIIKDKTENLGEVPINWKDHVGVIKGQKKRVTPDFVVKTGEDTFEELCGQYLRIDLDDEHKRLIDFLKLKGDAVWWWDTERHMLVTHTKHLKEAHASLTMRGIFETDTSASSEHNCFCYPLRKGAWAIRRFSQGVKEHPTWTQDKAGWTRCFLNKDPDLSTSARALGGVELGEGKGYQFREAEMAVKAAQQLGATVEIPTIACKRETVIKQQKDGKILVVVEKEKTDNPDAMVGWAAVKTKWQRIYTTNTVEDNEVDTPVCDDIVRHVVTEIERASTGWYLNSEGHWIKGSLELVRPFLKSFGHNPTLIEPIIGLCIQRSWREVNRPFENEYVGNRDWNRKGAKLKYVPNPDKESLKYSSWMKILNHVGSSLDIALKNNGWCVENGVLTGADYLKCWIASLFQKPYEPLPYLFLFGPQDCGKSILYEALQLLFDRGHVQANHALLNQTGFNGELANAILCYIEEVDLSKAKFAYNKVKDWVTSKTITIRAMQKDAYQLPNSTHWIQCANSHTFCPQFTGDTRITMINVPSLDPTEIIPKHKFIEMLKLEAADFLAAVISLELPEPNSRLSIPVITTAEKLNIENVNEPLIDKFVKEMCFEAPGNLAPYHEVYDAFIGWLPPELRHEYHKARFSKEFPTKFPKGTHTGNKAYIGNLSLTQPDPTIKPKATWTLNSKGYLETVK